jgi:hypothetical protein
MARPTLDRPSSVGDQRILLGARELLHHVLTRQRFPHRSEGFLVHQPHRATARRVLRATPAVVGLFAREGVSRIAGIERAVRASDDVDEVHASIVKGLSGPVLCQGCR